MRSKLKSAVATPDAAAVAAASGGDADGDTGLLALLPHLLLLVLLQLMLMLLLPYPLLLSPLPMPQPLLLLVLVGCPSTASELQAPELTAPRCYCPAAAKTVVTVMVLAAAGVPRAPSFYALYHT
jgi:hypothetical protein